jgi:hypothetical protein
MQLPGRAPLCRSSVVEESDKQAKQGPEIVGKSRNSATRLCIPLVTSFGSHVLKTFRVWTEVGASELQYLDRRTATA